MKRSTKIVLLSCLVAAVLLAGCGIWWLVGAVGSWFSGGDSPRLVPTAAEIVGVMPRGELYVATSVIEDYKSEQATEYHLGLFPEDHSCALLLRQKVSYVVDMDDVEYEPQADGRVVVRLPELRYVASTQEVRFVSDDEAFWKERIPSTTGMKTEVAERIRSRFDTAEHRLQANRYAQEAISHVLNAMGYEAEFWGVVTGGTER
ncbi:MAG: hypothetical protein II750_04235 [Bacteroidaceae bacterium]|nr:hypothetical protein [Bacteroidaceae bacterium]